MKRFTKNHPCVVCGKPDGCGYQGEKPDKPDIVFCLRVKEGCIRHRNGEPVLVRNGMGYVHKFRDTPRIDRSVRVSTTIYAQCNPPKRFFFYRPQHVRPPAGVSAESMDHYQCAYYGKSFAAPMYDSYLRIIGYQVRREDGSKQTLKGTHLRMFIRLKDWQYRSEPSPVLIVEGFSDCACCSGLLDGREVRVIGRPSNTSGENDIVALLAAHRYLSTNVVVLPDHDTEEPARTLTLDAAKRLVARLQRFLPTSMAEFPDSHKDARSMALHDICAATDFFRGIIKVNG